VAGQGFVDGVVQHFEHQVVQAGAVGGVADVHAGTLAHRLQAFQDLDGRSAVALLRGWCCLRGWRTWLPSEIAAKRLGAAKTEFWDESWNS
jgi:hypothetical protein